MMHKKYELTRETLVHNGKTLYRIRALKDFNDVKKGDLGGYVESEDNLSQKGNCWIYDDAKVFNNACVFGNAEIFDDAIVRDNAKVSDESKVYGNAHVCDDSKIYGNAHICGNCCICFNAKVFDDARVFDNAIISDNARVFGTAEVYDSAVILNTVDVSGCAKICGNALVDGFDDISANALITTRRDCASVNSFGSQCRKTTFFRCEDGLVRVNCGCFHGTIDEFRKRVIKTHGNNKYAKEYLALVDLMELRFSE